MKHVSTDLRLLLKRSSKYRMQQIGGCDMGQTNEEQKSCAQNLKRMIQFSNYGTY
jgi:hypothetical protein